MSQEIIRSAKSFIFKSVAFVTRQCVYMPISFDIITFTCALRLRHAFTRVHATFTQHLHARSWARVHTFHCHEIESVSDGNPEILCSSDVSYFSCNFAISDYSHCQFYIAPEFLSFSNFYFYPNSIL